MQLRNLVICLLLCLITLLLPFTAHAHETILQSTSISNLSYPTVAVLDASSSVIVPVSFTVTLSNTPIQSVYVFISILNEDTTTYADGSLIGSNPYSCQPFAQYSQSTVCHFVPLTSSGSENVEFGIHLTSAGTHHFKIVVAFVYNNVYPPQPVSSTVSSQPFEVTVTQPNVISSYTLNQVTTTPLQMPQPPQPMVTQSSNNTPQLALTLAAIAAVVIGGVFLYLRRKGRPKITKAEKVDIDATRPLTKTVEGKRFCIECGNELPPNLKFCDNCGTKQP